MGMNFFSQSYFCYFNENYNYAIRLIKKEVKFVTNTRSTYNLFS